MTITVPSFPLTGFVDALRRSWLIALMEAGIAALAFLGTGASGIDPEIGFRR